MRYNKHIEKYNISDRDTETMSDHHIRVATEADYDGVMAFGDVYLGIDYLQHKYHNFLKDPNATPYVYVIGEEIVGFCSPFFVDDGMTLLIRGSRVKKGHQGQGIYSKLTKHVYEELKGKASLKYESFTTNNLNYESNKQGLQRAYTEISRKSFLNYRFKTEDVQLPVASSKEKIKEMTPADMTSVFAAEKLHESLFPGGKVIIDWVPLRLLPANMKYIINPEIMALQSKNDNSKVSLLSLGASVPCQLGLRYNVDVFGNDVTFLRDHILLHLERIKKMAQDVVVFQITTDSAIEKTIDEMVKALGISDFGFEMNILVNFERDFKA